MAARKLTLTVSIDAVVSPGVAELLKHAGWTPPGESERDRILQVIRHFFEGYEAVPPEEVRILCGRIERGEHMPAKVG